MAKKIKNHDIFSEEDLNSLKKLNSLTEKLAKNLKKANQNLKEINELGKNLFKK